MDEIDELLSLHTLEEVFDELDITPYEVIQILLKHGYVELPYYVVREPDQTQAEDSE